MRRCPLETNEVIPALAKGFGTSGSDYLFSGDSYPSRGDSITLISFIDMLSSLGALENVMDKGVS